MRSPLNSYKAGLVVLVQLSQCYSVTVLQCYSVTVLHKYFTKIVTEQLLQLHCNSSYCSRMKLTIIKL